MPIPKTTSKSRIMRAIKKHHPEWSLEKKRAVMLDTARRAGAKIAKQAKKLRKKHT